MAVTVSYMNMNVTFLSFFSLPFFSYVFIFFLNYYLNLRGCVAVLEVVFVGQCEVFVWLDFVIFFPWP